MRKCLRIEKGTREWNTMNGKKHTHSPKMYFEKVSEQWETTCNAQSTKLNNCTEFCRLLYFSVWAKLFKWNHVWNMKRIQKSQPSTHSAGRILPNNHNEWNVIKWNTHETNENGYDGLVDEHISDCFLTWTMCEFFVCVCVSHTKKWKWNNVQHFSKLSDFSSISQRRIMFVEHYSSII